MPWPIQDVCSSSCEHEPINTPGAIQAHGVLVAVDEHDMRIAQISANAQKVFGCRARSMLGKKIGGYLDDRQHNALRKFLEQSIWSALQPITLSVWGGSERLGRFRAKWDVFCHRHAGLLLMEFEPAMPATKSLLYFRQLRTAFGEIHASKDVQSLCDSAAHAVRQITHFDRVMVYRFDADWHGEVIAESAKSSLDSYLHHHFPASDIPSQARAAFLNNFVRMIPDVYYTPVPLLNRKNDPPLDMARALLRSVSPIHLQYLKNMETRATLTVSLIKEGKLWGLIACHHSSKRHLLHEVRLACELIGKSVSALLGSREHMEEMGQADALRDNRAQLWGMLEKYGSVREVLWKHPEKLLSIVDAQGAAFRLDAEKSWVLVGKTPSQRQVADLAIWLSSHMSDNHSVFSTDHLSGHYRDAQSLCATACGLLVLTIPKAESNLIMWFRPELIQQKTWAGDPHKQVTYLPDGTVKIEPRHSFEAWKESVRLRSKPWKNIEIASAVAMRNDLVSVDLRLQFGLAQRAIRARDEFMSMASHELKTPLTSMRLQSQMMCRRLKDGLDHALDNCRTATALQRIDRGIDRLIRLVDDMLDISRIDSGRLVITCEKVGIVALTSDVVDRMRGQFDTAHVVLTVLHGEEIFGFWDRLRIEQCLTNLLSNALRYGQGTPVTVTIGLVDGKALLSVCDGGNGICPEAQKRIFEKFERAGQNAQGLGLGLYICKQIVSSHGGVIQVNSDIGKGARFCMSLPVYSPEVG